MSHLRSVKAPTKLLHLMDQGASDQAEQWPRILFLGSEPPGAGGAGSIYFHRLLRDVPASHLVVATHRPLPEKTERLPGHYIHQPLPLASLEDTRLWKLRFLARLSPLPKIISFNEINRNLAFQPDIILTLMQDSLMYESASHYAAKLGVPMAVFVHDLAHGFEPLPALLTPARLKADRDFLSRSSHIFAVSEGMRNYLQENWQLDSEVILPPAPERPFSRAPSLCADLKNPGHLTIGYAGGLHYGYGEQLIRMLPALRQTGTRVELFGSRPRGRLAELAEATDVMHVHGRLPTPEMAWEQISENCDAVLLPYANPAGEFALQYRTHFPSKLAEMTSLGLPVLVTGPRDAAGVAWCAQRPEAAVCVSDVDQESLVCALLRLRDDAEHRVALAEGAQCHARVFNAREIRRFFAKGLRKAIQAPK